MRKVFSCGVIAGVVGVQASSEEPSTVVPGTVHKDAIETHPEGMARVFNRLAEHKDQQAANIFTYLDKDVSEGMDVRKH